MGNQFPLYCRFRFTFNYAEQSEAHEHHANTPSTEPLRKANLEEYDLLVLSGGTGGTIAAWTFASQGQRVAVIERKYVGGSCPNIACWPSKNIIHSAKVLTEALQRVFEADGIDLVLKAQIKRISGKSSQAVRILIEKNGNGAKKRWRALICWWPRAALRILRELGWKLRELNSPIADTSR
jgi:hypothetical protein